MEQFEFGRQGATLVEGFLVQALVVGLIGYQLQNRVSYDNISVLFVRSFVL